VVVPIVLRMAKIYEVRVSTQQDGGEPMLSGHGSFFSRKEAEAQLANTRELFEATITPPNWERRCWIEEIDTTGLFEVPGPPKPRERFTTRVERTSAEHHWTQVHVDILDGDRVVGSYDRNYAMLSTFEPFRQGDRYFALVSPNYTATSVMDLATGKIIASEEPHPHGFCPVGFYVPDWWDVHSNYVLPGSLNWRKHHEWPNGEFGLVWGCIWGDDSSWKVQYLDLSRVQQGELRREERFGYLPITTHPDLPPDRFIHISSALSDDEEPEVEFEIPRTFGLNSGGPIRDND
jgi:hypothetical protein